MIWAIDAVDQVFGEIREVLWKTCNARDQCRVPKGCESVAAWEPQSRVENADDSGQSSSESPS